MILTRCILLRRLNLSRFAVGKKHVYIYIYIERERERESRFSGSEPVTMKKRSHWLMPLELFSVHMVLASRNL